jgi:hypothetical protein
MALDSKNNIKSVFIVPSKTQVAAGTRVTPGSLPLDSVVITNMSNVVLATGSGAGTGVQNYGTIKIIKDRGADLPLQQLILDLSTINTSSAVSGAPATEQVDFIGYNGSNTNTIQEISNNFYTVKLEHVPNQFAYGKRPANYKYGTYQSGISATKEQIANGLTASLVQNFRPNRTIDWRVFSEVMTNGVRSAAGTGSGTLTFTKYSKLVVPTLAAATSLCTAGTYISIATGLTSPVYRVADRNSTTGVLTLEVAYNGETVSGIAAGTALTSVTVAAATAATLWGIKITGIKQKYDVNRWRQYDKVRFNTFLEGFPPVANPTAVATTAAFDGIGVYEQAANDEYISWGDEGQIFVDQTPPLFREQDARPGTQYSPAVIGWLDKLPSLIGAGENKGQVILYFPGTLSSGVFTPAATSTQSDFVAVFNSWRAGSLPSGAWPDVVA